MHCCGGWQIPLSEESRQRLISMEPTWENSFRAVQNGWRLKQSKAKGGCIFLNDKGLCGMQASIGHEHLPRTCASYPRAMYSWKDENRVEVSGFLSCPEIARQILAGEGLELVESDYKHEMNDAGHFGSSTPYHKNLWNVRARMVALLEKNDLVSFLRAVAQAVALSPAFFHHGSRDDQVHRLEKRLQDEMDADLVPSAQAIENHFTELYALFQSPPDVDYPQALQALRISLQWVKEQGVQGWIDEDRSLMSDSKMQMYISLLCRYEWEAHPYVLYPNLFLYWFDFQMRLLLFRLLILGNPNQPRELLLACSERLLKHSAWLITLQKTMLSRSFSITPGLLSFTPWACQEVDL